MPPRGAPRGGAPRGGPGRGAAARGAPVGRGGPPPSTPNRGGAASRSRPPAQSQRMTPASALSHQQHSAKPEAYGEYVSQYPQHQQLLLFQQFYICRHLKSLGSV